MKNFFGVIIACVLVSLFFSWVGFEFWDFLIASFIGSMIGMIFA